MSTTSRRSTPNPENEALLGSTGRTEPKHKSPLSTLDISPSRLDKLSLTSIIIGSALFLPVTWYIVLRNGFSAGWFTPHPPLMSLSILLFLTGITPLQPPPPSSASRKTRFGIHQNVMGLGSLGMSVGVAAMWMNKHVHAAKHFTTWHSFFGLVTLGWVVVQGLVGGLSVWFGGEAFGGEVKAKKVYKYHRVSGYLLVTLALITAHLGGTWSTWSQGHRLFLRTLAYWIGLPLIWIGLTLRVRPSKMQFM